ncbi:MAG: hydrogenase iron-sulfur subunit [Candidatus Bathyarchaeia archaeon]
MGPGGQVLIHTVLCKAEGLETIKKLATAEKPKAIVVGACSKRACLPRLEGALAGAGLTSSQIEVANLREQCAWAHADDPKGAQAKAKRLLGVALTHAQELEPIPSKGFTRQQEALVIGAGVAGIQAALDLADQGFHVYLLDRSPTVGGKMALLVKTYPTDDCAICILGPKMADVAAHPNVTLLTYSEVKSAKETGDGFLVEVVKKPRYVDLSKCTGCGICAEKCPVKVPNEWNGGLGFRKAIYLAFPQALPRKYTIDRDHCLYFQRGVCRVCERFCPVKAPDYDQKPEEIRLKVGSIIVATGFEEYNPEALKQYGFGKIKDVITQYQLARVLDPSGPTQGKLIRFSDGERPRRVVMLQCVGSRDPEVNSYCSRYCCMAALKNAVLIKIEQSPEIEVTLLYRDLRAAGKGFEEYYTRAKERFGVKAVRGDSFSVEELPGGSQRITYLDPSGEKRQLEADLTVLSCAMVPSPGTRELAKALGLTVSRDGFVEALDEKVGTVETKVPGIYLCGAAEGPKDIPESVAQASAAAYKAGRFMARVVEKLLLVPSISEACGGCGLCEAACPFDAITVDQDEKRAHVSEMLCQGCGLCSSVCPNGAISLANNDRAGVSARLRAALDDSVGGPRPLILAVGCEECGYTLFDNAGFRRRAYPAAVVPITVPCLGFLSSSHIVDALSNGADKVLLLGCRKDRCHFGDGAEAAARKVKLLVKMLRDIGVSEDRLEVLEGHGVDVEDFVSKVEVMLGQAGG